METKNSPRLSKKSKKIDRIVRITIVAVTVVFTMFFFVREDIRNKDAIQQLEFELLQMNERVTGIERTLCPDATPCDL